MSERKEPPLWRDAAGVFIASVIVLSYIGIGFVIVAVKVVFDLAVEFPESWLSAMLSLSSVALGFLIKSKLDDKLPPRQ